MCGWSLQLILVFVHVEIGGNFPTNIHPQQSVDITSTAQTIMDSNMEGECWSPEKKFQEQLLALDAGNGQSRWMLSRAEQQELMNRVVVLKTCFEAKLCSSDYCLICDFWVVKMNDKEYLAKIDKKGDKETLDDLLWYVPVEDIYETLMKVHLEIGHGGCDCMLQSWIYVLWLSPFPRNSHHLLGILNTSWEFSTFPCSVRNS